MQKFLLIILREKFFHTHHQPELYLQRENTYYIAFEKCLYDDFDTDNVGIIGLSIIEKSTWNSEYVYRHDPDIPGIFIDKEQRSF